MEQIYIFDTTLRDGEQSPGASMSIEQKYEVAVQLESGATVQILDYDERVTDQSIGGYRLTSLEMDRNHTDVQWLRGRYTEGGTSWRGQLLMDTSGPRLENHEVMKLRVPDNIYATVLEDVLGLAAERGVALEVNGAALVSERKPHYPTVYAEICRTAKALGVRFTYGSDAHDYRKIGMRPEAARWIEETGLSTSDFLTPDDLRTRSR